ncbi:hypothetical protein [Thioalkalivibrio sulfidiphilus]|uniref:Tetratricopeptide TPR_4 n=1 Tax=Thioalkalivibrio sulfidiphilus (strain HL-EbGR7) TaxID=396588 RepID=B8GN80_THISH|nr:hypothetical protein [Thioalkalivibrio sulfidiphilus]ACL71941.1 Tetratricopeptide TPR_4 [Thioalkalivibrio sulfidiphilus HL-EbGr7]
MARHFLLLILMILPPLAHADPVVDEAMGLARLGAADLALATLDRQPPDRLTHPDRWMARERARLEILGMEQRWQGVVDRAARLPAGLPREFLIWARTREAHALLSLGRGEAARSVLRDLIWFSGDAVSEAWLDAWRGMLAESYWQDGLGDDALSTLRRWRQDRGEAAQIPLQLEARLLLDQGQGEEAARILERETGHEARALRALALLRTGSRPAEDLHRSMTQAAATADLPAPDRARYLAVAALAAAETTDLARRVEALEQAFAVQGRLPREEQMLRLDTDALWQAYLDLGESLGNERQLLIGDDDAWFTLADSLASRSRIQARALFAVVGVRGVDPEGRATAHRRLGESLLDRDDGAELMDVLYLEGGRFPTSEDVPAPVRHLLAEHAVDRGDLDTASRLMAGLSRPPEGVDGFEWGLRRARVLILGGQEEAGIDALYDLLSGVRQFDAERADRFLQVLFDLQTLRRHDAAVHLFRAVAPRLTDARQAREVLYWEADSHQALGQHEEAARLYLRSAGLGDGPWDPWGMTARFQAAGALAEAGHVSDARALYLDLLRVTREPERRVLLRQRLQQLDLR